MNHLLRLFVVGSLLTAAHAFAAGAFQGKVTLSVTSKDQPQTVDYAIKGSKMRIDTKIVEKEASDEADQTKAKKHDKKHKKDSDSTPQSGTTIMDMEKMEMLMLMADQKMYMTMSMKQPEQKAREQTSGAGQEVERTGKSETILGYKCDQIVVKDKDKGTTTELWVASDLGTFMGLGGGAGGAGGGGGGMFGGQKSATAGKWEEALKGKGGFPLRVVTRDATGTETYRMEATKIEPGTLPEAMFLPPTDYQKFAMPDMGSMMNQFR